jgi:hypothetical protein
MNIRFEYLYRDAGNFKNWGEVVFSNPNEVPADAAALMAEKVLIDHAYFVAGRAGVPDLHFSECNEELDHSWHEAHAFLSTDEQPTDAWTRNIEEFIESLRSASIE